ncbi:hypothetical protein B0H10DRAFT_2201140 [Mycena sp. CBHHK59/15]|nr:hypothetical protein B0H10DRAFT_2201140 [Mycena sp. CBHHK59/15]
MLSLTTKMALPKLYGISAMWTLNSCKDIRLVGSNGQTTSSMEGPSGRRRTGALELGAVRGTHGGSDPGAHAGADGAALGRYDVQHAQVADNDVSEQDEQDSTKA